MHLFLTDNTGRVVLHFAGFNFFILNIWTFDHHKKQTFAEEWLSDYCLTPHEQFFSYITVRTSYIQWNDDVCTTELQISCVFALWKRVKTHVLSDQSVHITHTYCCVSKLSKFGASLYSRVHNNTFLSLRNSP